MKKQLLFMALGTLVLASCSMDDPVVETQAADANGISFRTVMGSRAAETTTANLSEFYATAIESDGTVYSTFKDVTFTKGDGDVWSSETTYYWPHTNLRFYAYSPATTIDYDYLANNGQPALDAYSPETDDTSKQHDFIYATNTGLRSDFPSHIALTFHHALSQIVIKAKCGSETYEVKVAGIRVGYVNQTGQFTFPEPVLNTAPAGSWTNLKSPGNYSSIPVTPITLATDSKLIGTQAQSSIFVIPQTMSRWTPDAADEAAQKGAYLAVLIQLNQKLADGSVKRIYPVKDYQYGDGFPSGYAYAAVPINANWVAGKKYTYVLDFTDGAGKVDPDRPDPVDPDPDPENPDPYEPGDDILGHAIDFTLTVEAWDALSEVDAPMNGAINDANN